MSKISGETLSFLRSRYTDLTVGHLSPCGLVIIDTLYHGEPATVPRLAIECRDLWTDAEKARRFRMNRETKQHINIRRVTIMHQVEFGLRGLISGIMQGLKQSDIVFRVAGSPTNSDIYWGLTGRHEEVDNEESDEVVDEKEMLILGCLQDKRMSIINLSRTLGMPYQTVTNKTKSLMTKGLLSRKRFGKTYQYYLQREIEIRE